MGFRANTYAKCWSVEQKSDTMTSVRLSISRKNRNTGEYETDFSGFVSFVGSANAQKAALLKEGARIKIGDVDVTNRYDKEKNITYTNFKCFSFETNDDDAAQPAQQNQTAATSLDDCVQEDSDEDLPF